jgi:hypothetical protein
MDGRLRLRAVFGTLRRLCHDLPHAYLAVLLLLLSLTRAV